MGAGESKPGLAAVLAEARGDAELKDEAAPALGQELAALSQVRAPVHMACAVGPRCTVCGRGWWWQAQLVARVRALGVEVNEVRGSPVLLFMV